MQAVQEGASRTCAISIPSIILAIIAPSGATTAQTAHPFAAPTSIGALSLNSVAALTDVNRDGSPDVILPGIFFGTLVNTLDENGNVLAANGVGPGISAVPGASMSPTAIAMACGRIDQDEREDLVTVTTCGTVHFHKNLGSTQLGRSNFAPDVLFDNFHARFPVSPPFVSYSFPIAQVLDFDLDGMQDVLVAGGPVDRWTGATCPGFVCLYKGDGMGGFTSMRHALPGNVLDLEVADFDDNGTPDRLVVLMETGSLGAFAYDIVHLALVNGALVAVGSPQLVGPGRFTALELADVIGDTNKDYILAQTSSNGGTTSSQVYYFQGDGQGNVSTSVWGTFSLPPNVTTLGDFISSIQVGDFNHDAQPDLAILRGFVQAPLPYSATPATNANSEVLVAMGPGLLYAPFESIPLPGYHNFSATFSHLFPLLPLFAEPESLRPIDLGSDSTTDFLISGLRVIAPPCTTMIVTLRNLTPPVLGCARFEKVGEPSGGAPSHPARIGFDGGLPTPGNSHFACTIQNVQGGCLVGLMWSPVGLENLFTAYGFQFHLAPTEFASACVASGSLAGEGFHSFALPIPNQPSLVGDAGYFQYNYYDHVTGAFGGTQATGIWIGH